MSSPCFDTISTDVTGLWTSPGKCKTPSPDQELLKSPPSKRKSSVKPCPRSMTIICATRQLVVERAQRPICLEENSCTSNDGKEVALVKMGRSHVLCREYIETLLLEHKLSAAVPWRLPSPMTGCLRAVCRWGKWGYAGRVACDVSPC
jgi:hypothetical protein